MNENLDKKSNFMPLLGTLLLVSFVVSFQKFYLEKDYDILVHIPCDNTVEKCITDGENYYNNFVVHASVMNVHCKNADYQCIEELYLQGMAEKAGCDMFVSGEESCVEPQNPS